METRLSIWETGQTTIFDATEPEQTGGLFSDVLLEAVQLVVLVDGQVAPVLAEGVQEKEEQAQTGEARENGGEDERRLVNQQVLDHVNYPVFVQLPIELEQRPREDGQFLEDEEPEPEDEEAEETVSRNEAWSVLPVK